MNRVAAMLGILVLVGGVVAVFIRATDAPPPPAPAQPPKDEPALRTFPLPPYSEPHARNAGPDARFIGTAACAACHPANHQSYRLTAHSRALSDVAPDREPPDAAFDHARSGRSYRVYRKDGWLRHAEAARTAEGREVAGIDLPVRYLIGSGHFCRSYLVEVDGFLHESPLTWYASKNKWDLSPGYDAAGHWSFERPIRLNCLACHAGRVEEAGGTVHKMTIHEMAIGCENCHGPGSLHQDLHRSRNLAPGERDDTIVHPAKLPRAVAESVCAACHLSTPATVDVRGRRVTDSRPGRPLSDYRVHYTFDSESERMTVVGHVEQLRQSKCYQASPAMTCTTCHDPHAREKPADPAALYRQKCLDCHTTKPCTSPPEARHKMTPADNCTACHMPRGDTDIPHVAFTHHRIRRHAALPALPSGDRIPDLVPLDDNPHLNPTDRRRNLGMAYMEVYRNPTYARYAAAYGVRAREHLEAVYRGGMRDAETVFALAELSILARDTERAGAFARETLASSDLQPDTRAKCLQILAMCERAGGNLAGAAALLEQNTKLRRYADDWRLLGANCLDGGDPARALPAFEQALAIRPYRHTTHLGLAECYRRLGQPMRATEHLEKAQWLRLNRQD
jgi:hypothetical protein